jgi:hypothetical protein
MHYDHHFNGPEEFAPATSNHRSFWPALLKLEKGEADTGIYIPALQVTMKKIQVLKNMAMLENSGMGSNDIDQLKDPECLHCTLDISDMHLVKAL